jgi:hypothetical protein
VRKQWKALKGRSVTTDSVRTPKGPLSTPRAKSSLHAFQSKLEKVNKRKLDSEKLAELRSRKTVIKLTFHIETIMILRAFLEAEIVTLFCKKNKDSLNG